MLVFSIVSGCLILWLIITLLTCLTTVQQGSQLVVLTLGKFSTVKDPGLNWIWRPFQTGIVVDIRSRAVDVPKQFVIMADNISATIDAVVYFRIKDPEKAIFQVAGYTNAVANLAQAALRDVTGTMTLIDLLRNRTEIAEKIEQILDRRTNQWGIDVEEVKLQSIELPEDTKRAWAKQAEAEREKAAAQIRAEGEKIAADGIAEAAEKLAKIPNGLAIRTLQTIE
ncbi:MAG: SPFH domain-containing protein [Candidatus Nomurabacteria bacterium]|jgi:regulator of protease activity HflC (stomatin/prohibitin superfamily)|nr:SPFH domain-containing protein [Candidatus Nomurabacteria bacterium]